MADHTSLVCSPELATALSPYFLIEVDEDTLNTLQSSPLVLQQQPNNLCGAFSQASTFSLYQNQQLSSYVSVQNGVQVGHLLEKQTKAGVVLHIDKACLKLKTRPPERHLIYKVLRKYPYQAQDSKGISLDNLAKATGISNTQIQDILSKDTRYSIKVKRNLEICWLEKRIIDATGSHLLPLIKSFPLSKDEAADLLESINQFNQEILDATLCSLFSHSLSYSDLSGGIPEDALFHFDKHKFYSFLVNKMTKEKCEFQLEQFKEVFLQLCQFLLSQESLESIDLKIDNPDSNYVHGYEDLDLKFLEGRAIVDIKNQNVYLRQVIDDLRFVNALELADDPKQRASQLSELKLKWFNKELRGLMIDCFLSEAEYLKFLKQNYDETSLRSFFDFETKLGVYVFKQNK